MTNSAQFISYAQHGEDVILWRALGDRPAGFYVDCGAFDPSYDSVTRALYERGWRGINIEPQPERLAAFERERPDDTNLSLAVGDSDGVASLTLPDIAGWASLLDPVVTGSDTMPFRTLEVPLRRLDSLLRELSVEHVDILKIDVEGAEPAVVRGLLDGPIRPLVCVVEGVAPGIGRVAGDEAVALLVEAGYLHCLFDGLNHYLTTDPALKEALSVAANPLDGYVTNTVDRLMRERHELHATIAALAAENLGLRSVAIASSEGGPEQVIEQDQIVAEMAVAEPAAAEHDSVPFSGGDLPQPSPEEHEVHSAPAVPELTRGTERRPSSLEPSVRAARRRAAFAQLLRTTRRPLFRPEPAGSTTRLLTLAFSDLEPAESISVLYRAVLGREADALGLAGWSARLIGGESLLTLARELADSDEALGRSAEDRVRVLTDLSTWESIIALTELGITWQPDHPYAPGSVSHGVFVDALFEVALQRRPLPEEARFEVAKLEGGVGRDWLLRAYAARPEVRSRLLGEIRPGLRGKLHRWQSERGHVDNFRMLVVAAEARYIARFLGNLSSQGPALQDLIRARLTASQEL